MDNVGDSLIILETERLILRKFTKDDMDFVFHHFAQEETNRYSSFEDLTTIEGARDLYDKFLVPGFPDRFRLCMVLKETGEAIGTIGLHKWSKGDRRAEIGCDMVKAQWGKGLMTEAVIEGEVIGDYFSHSLSGNHDLNGDGLNDVIIGADEHTDILWQDGKTYVYSILPSKRGDINRDSKIDVLDVIKAVNIILGKLPSPTKYEFWAADIICNGEINVEDVLEIVNLILRITNGHTIRQ